MSCANTRSREASKAWSILANLIPYCLSSTKSRRNITEPKFLDASLCPIKVLSFPTPYHLIHEITVFLEEGTEKQSNPYCGLPTQDFVPHECKILGWKLENHLPKASSFGFDSKMRIAERNNHRLLFPFKNKSIILQRIIGLYCAVYKNLSTIMSIPAF